MKQLNDRDVKNTVQVMAFGREIDRITRPLLPSGSGPTVVYRRRIWPVSGGCINVEDEQTSLAAPENSDAHAWMQRLTHVLPHPLPANQKDCAKILRTALHTNLPDGIIRAASRLASMGHEIEARELLVDFLELISPSDRTKTQAQLVTRQDIATPPYTSEIDQLEPPIDQITAPSDLDEEELPTLTWLPEQEVQMPAVDDSSLRTEVGSLQKGLGSYSIQESGFIIEGLDETPDEQSWEITASAAEASKQQSNEQERILLQRTLSLGSTALDILRYFADNPGDRAAHVEQVLGYSLSAVNGLLNGKLSQYLQRTPSGGWSCQSWVPDILDALERKS